MAEVWVGISLRPAIEGFRERCCLCAPNRQVPLKNEHEHNVALGGEVCDVLGDDSSALRTGSCRDLRVLGGLEADLSYVHRVVVIGITQEHGGCDWEHLVDQELDHASSAAR